MSSNHFNDFSWFVQICFHFLIAMNNLQHGSRQTLSLSDNGKKNSIFCIAALVTRLKWQQACSIDWKINFMEWRLWSSYWTFQFSYGSVTYSKKFGPGPATQNYPSRKDGLALHVTSFYFSTIPFTVNQSQPARENPLSYSVVRNMISFPFMCPKINTYSLRLQLIE